MNKKTAVITGASSGSGLELARSCAAHGVAVRAIQMDIAQPFSGAALCQAVSARMPYIDVLVNNAGLGDYGDFSAEPPENIERMIHLNISALTSLTRYALPGMIARKNGKILNVASLAGFQPGGPGMAVYYATQSYVLSFSRGIRRELRGAGVDITTLCPGPTYTEFEASAKTQNSWLFHWTKPMAASIVARADYRGIQRGCGVVVPGLLNKFLAIGAVLPPSSIALEINRYLLSERN